MSYNVWLGFDRKQNLDKATTWIAAQHTDVLALQELKGFSQERLETAAKKWGHPHALIYERKGGFPQGVSSKTPIELVEQIRPEGADNLRGTLHCRTAGIDFFVVHFDPRNFLRRRLEAAAVTKRAAPLVEAGKPVIVLGDFNAHSDRDREMLEARPELLEMWRQKEKEEKNFRAFDNDGRPDFSVLRTLLDAGLADPATTPRGTFPTRILAPDESPEQHAARLERIDFILADPGTMKRGATLSFPRDQVLDEISDHYPVLLVFE